MFRILSKEIWPPKTLWEIWMSMFLDVSEVIESKSVVRFRLRSLDQVITSLLRLTVHNCRSPACVALFAYILLIQFVCTTLSANARPCSQWLLDFFFSIAQQAIEDFLIGPPAPPIFSVATPGSYEPDLVDRGQRCIFQPAPLCLQPCSTNPTLWIAGCGLFFCLPYVCSHP